ncbi:hypothetical protein JHK82_029985 [Glycine max]|nr:hypothetical protein JHK86_030071 [Glycine max]KAG5123248.1 hypothetical protein JHK82_029985 [Glycine max]KAG5144663.1 hypothetical protein JHK84_030206 [Glycine max]
MNCVEPCSRCVENMALDLQLFPQSKTHATNPTLPGSKSCLTATIRSSFSPLVVALVRPRNSPLGGVKENCNAGDQIKDAICCIHENPEMRPTMEKAMPMLEGLVEVPNPTHHRSFPHTQYLN